ncbi:MAG: isochorismatase family protein [Bryobacterales bacterium]|nr:isochorismatase family protein [Bryobacterales bacterium]
MTRRIVLGVLAALSTGAAHQQERALLLRARSRQYDLEAETALRWKVRETAIIVCDMWDDHYCKSSARRVVEIAPRMNAVLKAARAIGVQIIHAPSGTMDVYANTPQRKRMQSARKAAPPVPIAKWCYLEEGKEGKLPIDDATEPCDDPVVGEKVRRYNRQNALLDIAEPDGISDSGEEIYSFFEQQGIRNVALMGVHLNMCVLGRPFGIRQMTKLGKSVVLARDLTDSMYDPRQKPYVSHAAGTELMVKHVEKHWCPSIVGEDLTRLAPKAL